MKDRLAKIRRAVAPDGGREWAEPGPPDATAPEDPTAVHATPPDPEDPGPAATPSPALEPEQPTTELATAATGESATGPDTEGANTTIFSADDLANASAAPAPAAEWAPVGGVTPPPVPEPPPTPADVDPAVATDSAGPSFRDRGRMRRRLRYLRRVRELGFRDVGGLVFDLHRFGREGESLVTAKLDALDLVDRELRALERALDDRPVHMDLREPGIAACQRCGTLHGSDAKFCPACGARIGAPAGFGDAPGATPPDPPVA